MPETEEERVLNTGVIYASRKDIEGEILINVLSQVEGASNPEILQYSESLRWKGLEIPVVHSVLLLQSKVHLLANKNQTERQDHKHVILSVANARGYLSNLDDKDTFGWWVHRIIDIAQDKDGLACHKMYEIDIVSAIPWDRVKAYNLDSDFVEKDIRESIPAMVLENEDLDSWVNDLKNSNDPSIHKDNDDMEIEM